MPPKINTMFMLAYSAMSETTYKGVFVAMICHVFVSLKTKDMQRAWGLLRQKFPDVRVEDGCIRVYDVNDTEGIVKLLLENGHAVSEITKNKIGLEEYYVELMSKKEA